MEQKKGNELSDNAEPKEWEHFSSYKKAEYLMINKPDCSFVVGRPDCETKTFHFHTWILGNASPVFQTMFNGHFKESNQSNEIRITDTDPITFKKFMDFIYYGNTENFLLIDILTVRNLIYLGKKYMVVSLAEICIEIMKKNLEILENDDLIYIFEYAHLMEDEKLIKKCKKVIIGRKSKADFSNIPVDHNINRQEEKRLLAHGRRVLNPSVQSKPSTSSQTNPLIGNFIFNNHITTPTAPTTTSTAATRANLFENANNINQPLNGRQQPVGMDPSTNKGIFEEKIENTDNIFQQSFKDDINIFGSTFLGVNKGDITTCSCIYDLNPPIFNEFQKNLSGHISEFARFGMIETYAKINGFVGEIIDHAEKTLDNNSNNNNNNKVTNNETAEINKSSDNIPEALKNQTPHTMALQKEMLNMMLCSINFLRMSAKDFCRGPGKSSLFDTEEKYNILVGIINKN